MGNVAEIDMSDMYSIVKEFPNLLAQFKIDSEIQEGCIRLGDEGINGIIIIGMGGSAIAGRYVQEITRNSASVPLLVIQEYLLPAYIDSSWAALVISYSGNTEETLTAYDQAIKRGCPTFTITSGGELHTKGNSLREIHLKGGYQPRAAFPIIFPPVLNLVECLLGLKPTDLTNIANSLLGKISEWEKSSVAPKVFAQDLFGNVPVFIGSRHLVPVAYRAKCQMNENAKTMAFYSVIPEANHNEIESFIAKNDFQMLPVFLRSKFEDERIKKRIDITTTLYEEEGYSPVRLSINSSSELEEMLAHTLFLDLVSVELAQIRGVNPGSVDRISRLKNELNRD